MFHFVTKKSASLLGLIALVACIILLSGGASTASRLINGRDIESDSIKSRHIRDGSVTENDLDWYLRDRLSKKDDQIDDLQKQVHDLELQVANLTTIIYDTSGEKTGP